MQEHPAIKEALLQLRVMHVGMMVSILLYIYVLTLLPPPRLDPKLPVMFWSVWIITAPTLLLGQWIRSRELRAAFETLRTKLDDAASLRRWRFGIILSDVMAEAVVLYGFSIRMFGGTSLQVAPFFVLGALVLLLWWPRRP